MDITRTMMMLHLVVIHPKKVDAPAPVAAAPEEPKKED
jgi:hypothetical protein